MLPVALVTLLFASACCVAVCCGGMGQLSKQADANYGSADDSSTRYDAKIYAREAVKLHLKWPDDAEFPGGEEVSQVRGKPGYFNVTGKVKAANGFGIKLTSPFVAEVRLHSKATKEWRYHYVELKGEVLYSQPWKG
jgi:hypothetical protein